LLESEVLLMPYILVARNEDFESRLLGCREQLAVLESVPAQILGLYHLVTSQKLG
jgi:hypothetical protein